jgi:hypothetical protein
MWLKIRISGGDHKIPSQVFTNLRDITTFYCLGKYILSVVARFLGTQGEESQWPPIKEIINLKNTLIKFPYIRLSNFKYVEGRKFIFAPALKIRKWTIETFFRLFNADTEEVFDTTNVLITPKSKLWSARVVGSVIGFHWNTEWSVTLFYVFHSWSSSPFLSSSCDM